MSERWKGFAQTLRHDLGYSGDDEDNRWFEDHLAKVLGDVYERGVRSVQMKCGDTKPGTITPCERRIGHPGVCNIDAGLARLADIKDGAIAQMPPPIDERIATALESIARSQRVIALMSFESTMTLEARDVLLEAIQVLVVKG